MATFDYSGLQSTADDLLRQFGRTLELRRADGASGSSSRSCVAVDTGNAASIAGQERNGQLILASDRVFLMSAVGLEPAPDPEEEQLIVDDKAHRIVAADPMKPADTILVYEVLARR